VGFVEITDGDRPGAGGEPQREGGSFAFAGFDPHVASVVAGDVADDGQPEAGAAGVATARSVVGMPMPSSRTAISIAVPSAVEATRTVEPWSLYLQAFSSRLASADTSCRRSPRTV
jgi:hypothetical protein